MEQKSTRQSLPGFAHLLAVSKLPDGEAEILPHREKHARDYAS
jgi:hypothetical protein